MIDDTICAPATPPINSSISIIRISGPKSKGATDSIFNNSKKLTPRNSVYGSIFWRNKKIDDVVAVFYEAPYSYSGEDMVEIFCHGNQLIVYKIIEILSELGIRMAEPGEFSKRAFLNGKMDLTEAEAVNQLILARSDWEIDAALKQMHGSLKNILDEIKEQVVTVKADIESGIDFIEEDIEFVSNKEIFSIAEKISSSIDDVLLRCKVGNKISNGIDVAIVGRPNVGKSSILNLFVNRERAIVSNIPGTTRDLIKESIQLGGVPVNLIDTAGIDTPGDEIERIGINLSHQEIENASILLLVLDASIGLLPQDKKIIEEVKNKKTFFILNKIDIASKEQVASIKNELPCNLVEFSALKGIGLDTLEAELEKVFVSQFISVENPFLADMRIIQLLERAKDSLEKVKVLLENNEPAEILAFEFQSVLDFIGEITGEISPNDILESIFSRFCIGK